MLSDTNAQKIKECTKKLVTFLNNKRYTSDMAEKCTHQSWGSVIQGSFYIDKNNMEEFLKLYCTAVENNVSNLSILEIQKEYSPIIIDIDLKGPNLFDNNRLYTNDMIIKLNNNLLKVVQNYIVFDNSNINICLFEKAKPSELDEIYKDGFHIMIPNICANTHLRHLIRNKLVDTSIEDCIFESFLDPPDKIIDKAVVSSNGWFLYGSRKPGGQTYKLTKIFNTALDVISYSGSTTDIIRWLSIHIKKTKYSEKNKSQYVNGITDEIIIMEYNKYNINTQSIINKSVCNSKSEISENKLELITKAQKFVNMLSDSRADNYEDWRNVGLALHNTDPSLLPVWLEFSAKSQRYNEKSCYTFWNSFKTPSAGNLLTIRSLAYWAKNDDIKEYTAFITEEIKKYRDASISGSTYKLAKSFYTKYNDKFVCSSIKKNRWWEFNNHRWVKIDDAYSITILLSEDFQNDYRIDLINLNTKIMTLSDTEKEMTQVKITKINKIVEKLMDIDFKKKIIEESKAIFYDPKFEEKIDSNINLLGFENGVYDLEKKIFRHGYPDDYISMSTKINYIPFTPKMPYYTEINNFFEQVLPILNVRKYFINALSTCVCGNTKEEKFYILTGCGSNGKSLTMDLMSGALGDYFMACPISIITKKSGKSNEAAPEKVRMRGKRCGVFQETDDGEKLNVGVMKEFTGGDKVLVRDLFKGADEMLEFRPQMKYFLTCNQLPIVPSNDDGTWRRLRVIDFNSKFVDNPTKSNEFKIDTKLKQNLKKWVITFCSYLIHIYLTEYELGLHNKEPEEVLMSTNQYKLANDIFTEYITIRLTLTENINDLINKETLYSDFKLWYDEARYDVKLLPKKNEFDKNIIKFCDKSTPTHYCRIIFRQNENVLDK